MVAREVEAKMRARIAEGSISLGYIQANINGLVRSMHEETEISHIKHELKTLTFKKGILYKTEFEQRVNMLNKSEGPPQRVLPLEEEKRRSPSPSEQDVKMMVKKLSFERF